MPGAPALADLPFWPRCLARAEAARYLGVSVDVFDAELKMGIWPPGRPRGAKGGRLTWDRAVLDAALDRQAGLADPAAIAASGLAEADDATKLQERLRAAFGKSRPQRLPQEAA